MKNYNKILEAVNRGILLALDDIEDQDDIQILSYGKIKNDYKSKDYIDLMNYVVDLGLPSGTLWCKYNLGVELDDSFKPLHGIGIGNYYAWGEIKSKSYYDWVDRDHPEQNYKWANGKIDELTKYITNNEYAAYFDEDSEIVVNIDNLRLLLPEDDAAYQNMHVGNYKFHIPTKELFRELLYYTNATWKNIKKDFSIYRCIELTSKNNGNKIVFPAYGYYYENKRMSIGHVGHYWSSDIGSIDCMSVALIFEDTAIKTIIEMKNIYRKMGLQIRPVINLN